MIVTLDDCAHAMERLAVQPTAEPGGTAHSADTLSCIRIAEEPYAVILRAALSPGDGPPVTVDCTPQALVLRCGAVERRVPLSADVLWDHAVVQVAAEGVTVTMPVKERRIRRHVVYVW